jgi:hypothetical protein
LFWFEDEIATGGQVIGESDASARSAVMLESQLCLLAD